MNSNRNKGSQKFREVLAFITKNNGITYAENKMKEYAAKAVSELAVFENNEVRQALEKFVSYAIERNK